MNKFIYGLATFYSGIFIAVVFLIKNILFPVSRFLIIFLIKFSLIALSGAKPVYVINQKSEK